MTTNTDFNAIISTIGVLLQQEENTTIASRADLDEHMLRRADILEHIEQLLAIPNQFQQRALRLKQLPRVEHVEWAEACLKMKNLLFLVLDTTGLGHDSDIIRVHAANQYGPVLDVIIAPQRQKHEANTSYTAISQEEIDQAPAIADVWPLISRTLSGHFIISYNLDFVKARLDDNIKHYGLARLPLIGDCLQHKVMEYYRTGYSLKLSDVSKRIGHNLLMPSLASDRAVAQLALLRAMSQGIIDVLVKTTTITADTELDELDDRPF